MNEKTGILIVDDHAIARMGLASLLTSKRVFKVVGQAKSGKEAIAEALRTHPDVIIMDLLMPEMDGAETTRRLIELWPEAKILILTTFGTADAIGHALQNGALGAVMKNVEFDELIAAIHTVAAGHRVVSDEIERILSEHPPVSSLSPRQRQLLDAFARGLSNNDISTTLGISIDMVKEHSSSIFQKLGAANRAEAVAIAIRKHLL